MNCPKLLYISLILITSIIITISWIQSTVFTNIFFIINPLYIITSFILLINLTINIIPNINKKIIKLSYYINLSFYIVTMSVLYYRNMLSIIGNVFLTAINVYDIYNLSYGLLIVTYFTIIMFTDRSIVQDIIIIGYQITCVILCLLIELHFRKNYYTHPNFNTAIFIENMIQLIMTGICIIYRIINYVKYENNPKIINIMDTMFYIITMIISIMQTIRINKYLQYYVLN